jgi:hypothetical protein
MPPKAIIGAVLARCPRSSAGHLCSVMNWALGLRSLGWEVWLVEHIGGEEVSEPDAGRASSPQEVYWEEVCRGFGFGDHACLLVNGRSPRLEAFRDFAAGADLFLNYSGQFKRLDLLGPRPLKCYLDVDPAFTQIWAEGYGCDMNLHGHDLHLTVGLNLGAPDALVPRAGCDWLPVRPPVAARAWREIAPAGTRPPAGAAWSTVAHWYGYGDIEWQGRQYGGKRTSFLELRGVPAAAGLPVTIATDLEKSWGDFEEFTASGWTIIPASSVCLDVPSYVGFLASSRGELGVAKHGYVASRCGWMSDRSVIYLALGRPVVLQDTGWTRVLEPRPGMLAFADAAGAAAGMREVEAAYDAHSAGAEVLADTEFSPRRALEPMLERLH